MSFTTTSPDPRLGITQEQPVTPAMAAGLTDHVWTMEELLSYRVPPDFRDRLVQQTANVTS